MLLFFTILNIKLIEFLIKKKHFIEAFNQSYCENLIGTKISNYRIHAK